MAEPQTLARSESSRLQIPAYAWVLTLVVTLGVVAAIVYIVRAPDREHGSGMRFVGPGKCVECHEEQSRSWSQTRMAKSFEVLRPGVKTAEKKMAGLDPDMDYTTEQECLPCHTTGYGLVGGFVSIEDTPEMAGVTCEACHGPGGLYSETYMAQEDPSFPTSEARKAGLVYPPTARVCRKCHNEDSPFVGMNYEFDYDARVSSGTHAHFELKYEHKNGGTRLGKKGREAARPDLRAAADGGSAQSSDGPPGK